MLAVLGVLAYATISQPDTAAAFEYSVHLECPASVQEGQSFDVTLVYVTEENADVKIGAHWYTDPGTATTTDYTARTGDMVWHTFNGGKRRVTETFQTTQDERVEGDETFTVRFGPEFHVTDVDDPDRDHKCEVTIKDDDPNLTSLSVVSEPARDNDTYGVGETIEIEATFNNDVIVDGNPGLGMWVGSSWKAAMYLRQSADDKVVFGYTVQSADRASYGFHMDGGYRDSSGTWHNFLNHTAITSYVATQPTTAAASSADEGQLRTNAVNRVYPHLPKQAGHKVDGSLLPYGVDSSVTSSPASGDTYRKGETVEFSIEFSAPLEITGGRHLSLRVGPFDSSGWRGASYTRGSGTDTFVFGYTVQTTDMDNNGVTMLGTWTEGDVIKGLGGSGTVKVKGTDITLTPTFSGFSNASGHKVNGQPYVKSLAITSTPTAASDTYGMGEVIQLSVTFDQNVTAADSAKAAIGIHSLANRGNADYVSGNGTDTLVFEYTVDDNDFDNNGVQAYVPEGQDIKATGTDVLYQYNPGGQTPTLDDDPNHKIDSSLVAEDTTAPTVTSVEITSDAGDDDTYEEGDEVEFTATFSERVTVTAGEGTDGPQLEFTLGSATKFAVYDSTSGSGVTFTYTVVEGDSDSDGISIGADAIGLLLGTIRDGADNDAVLTHSAVDADSDHMVSAPDVTPPSVTSVSFISDPGDDDTYVAGDVVRVQVDFSERIIVTATVDDDGTVSGTPEIELNFNGDGRAATMTESTDAGNGIVFAYTVVAGDNAPEGIGIRAERLRIPEGGTIRDTADNDATLNNPLITPQDGHLVDAVNPSVDAISISSSPASGDTYLNGEVIEVTVEFSETIVLTGTPQLSLVMGDSTVTASYTSEEYGDVVFSYTVSVGDIDSDGISINANALSLNGGTIADKAGNDANLDHEALAADTDHKVSAPGGL